MQEGNINIITTDAEGENKIIQIKLLRLNLLKLMIFSLLALFTGGILGLLALWIIRLRKLLLFSECSISNATHVLIKNNDQTLDIILLEVDFIFAFKKNLIKYS